MAMLGRWIVRRLMARVLAAIWIVILVLVGGRFLALLFDANRNSDIVERIYRHSDFWVKPFFGIFDLGNKAVHNTGGVFEPASLIALVVYFIVGKIVLSLLSAPIGWRRRWPLL